MQPSPLPRSMRFVGANGSQARAPFGLARLTDDGEAWLVALTDAHSVAAAAAELPLPSALDPGTLMVILPHAPAQGGLLSLFSSGRSASRSVRAGALLVRGYVELGACIDPHTKLDLVWGRAR
jgi:hypothetical protein